MKYIYCCLISFLVYKPNIHAQNYYESIEAKSIEVKIESAREEYEKLSLKIYNFTGTPCITPNYNDCHLVVMPEIDCSNPKIRKKWKCLCENKDKTKRADEECREISSKNED